MQRLKSIGCILIVSIIMSYLSGCDTRNSEQNKEAKDFLSAIQKVECMQKYEQYKHNGRWVYDSHINLCLWGDCNLQDIFEITECANEYLASHSDSIIVTRHMELKITFFNHEPDKHDYEWLRYYACVSKMPEETSMNMLSVRTSDTIYTSEFRNCPAPFKNIELAYSVEFDEPEALQTISGLEGVSFSSATVNKEELVRILEEVCYYDEHNINLNFGFGFGVGLDRDLMKVYNEFALAHADYRVFQDDKGEVFLYDD